MSLKTPEGIELHMRATGYQFPQLEKEEYDSNWLQIQVTVKHPRGAWAKTDPSLLTFELKSLGDWLHQVSTGNYSKRDLYFTEPNLEFHIVPKTGPPERLSVVLSHENAPPFVQKADRYEGFPLEFPLSGIDLEAASRAVLIQVQAFPQRGDR